MYILKLYIEKNMILWKNSDTIVIIPNIEKVWLVNDTTNDSLCNRK